MNFLALKSNVFRLCAVAWVLTSIAILPTVYAQSAEYMAAMSAYQSKDFDEAHEIWNSLASLGDYNAQYALGVMALRGESDKASPETAFHWFSLAADQGHSTAMFNVGVAYWDGFGVAQDRNEGLRWWKKSAKAGDAAAQYNLGLAYYLDKDKPENIKKAAKWIGLSAKQQYPEAVELYGTLNKLHPEIVVTENSQNDAQETKTTKAPTQSPTASTDAKTAAIQPKSDSPEPDITDDQIATDISSEKPVNTADEPEQSGGTATSSSAQSQDNTAQSQAPKNEYWKTTANSALRVAPAPSGTAFGTLPEGTPVEILDARNYWTLITLPDGLKTWIYQDYLDTSGNTGVIQGSGVRVRPKPSTDNSVAPPIGAYQNGDRVVILEKQGDWYGIRAPKNIGGWISNKHITRYQDTETNRKNLWEEMAAKGL